MAAESVTANFQSKSQDNEFYPSDDVLNDSEEDGDILYDDFDGVLEDLDEDSLALFHNISSNDEGEKAQKRYEDDLRKEEKVSKALVPSDLNEDDDGDDIDSEEERDILKGIKAEIEIKVREEMKDELEGYKQKQRAIEFKSGGAEEEIKGEDDLGDEDEMDPKLKEAFIKMNKLDRILKKKIKREKEVKKERILLERRMRQEISEMQHGIPHYKEIKVNTEKFLSLTLPPSHNEGVQVDEEDPDLPPVFQTQIDESEILWQQGKNRNIDGNDSSQNGLRPGSTLSSQDGNARSETSNSLPKDGKLHKKGKNFIMRNKELAANADQVVAMTDDEKKRLQDLLEDIDDLPELHDVEPDDSVYNAWLSKVSNTPGEGFSLDNAEMKSMTHINERLKAIMPEDDFNSILEPPSSQKSTPRLPLFTRVGVRSFADIPERFGEQVLYETKEARELKVRLQSIEQELDKFKAPQDTQENSPSDFHLTDEELDNLLSQCARNMSRVSFNDTPDISSRSQVSSRQSLLENLPRLSEEQLQQLLSEAHFPLSSRLLALRDDDQKIADGEGNAEVIQAETWKTIRESDVESSKVPNNTLYPEAEGNISQNAFKNTQNIHDVFSEKPKTTASFRMDNLPSFNEEVVLSKDGKTEFVTTSLSDNGSIQGSENTSVTAMSSDSFGGFPKLRASRNASRSSPYVEQLTGGLAMPTSSTRESIECSSDSVRLPDIHTNSFLIQTTQGMNNDKKSKEMLPSRQQIQLVHNDLSDTNCSSTTESDGGILSGHNRSSSEFKSIMEPSTPVTEQQHGNSTLSRTVD